MSKLRMISRGIAAYDSLNAIYLDKADPDMTEFAITLEREHGVDALRDALEDAFKKRIYGDDPDNLLGNYILKKADRAFFIKYMMEGNTQLLIFMEDCLAATAGCDKSGSDWAERCKTNEAADMYEDADSGMRAEYDLWHQDGAINLMREIRELMDNYKRGCEALKEDGEDLAAHPQVLYPLLAGMTASQRIILEIGGLDMFIRSLVNNDGYEDERESRIEECGEKLQDLGFTDGKIWLWQGVDQSIYDSKIVETSDSIEKQGAGEDVRDYINEPLRQQFDTTQYALEILSLCWDVFSLVDMGVKLIVGTEVSQLLWVATLYFYHAIQGATIFM